jgi:gluconolactonase
MSSLYPFAFLLVLLGSMAWAADPDLSKVPLPAGLVAPEAKVVPGAVVCFLEGPAVDADGNVFFSDIAGNRILKMDPAGKVTTFRADSGRTNGNCFDAQGRLISCEGGEQGVGRRRIVRTDMKTGDITVLTDKYEGKRYNSPNDVCVDTKGRIWFTDPRYGDRGDLELDVEAVYRIDPSTSPPSKGGDTGGVVTRVLAPPAVQKPNGIAISPDDKTLYVIDSNPAAGGNRKIWAFDVSADGKPANQRLVYDFGKGRGGDGMRLDMNGNLWVAAGISYKRSAGETTDVPPGIYVITPQGKLLGRIPIGEDLLTNLAFGGPERKTLYITAGKTVYKIPVNVSGYALYPPLKK